MGVVLVFVFNISDVVTFGKIFVILPPPCSPMKKINNFHDCDDMGGCIVMILIF